MGSLGFVKSPGKFNAQSYEPFFGTPIKALK
jgi:hypothetical protein